MTSDSVKDSLRFRDRPREPSITCQQGDYVVFHTEHDRAVLVADADDTQCTLRQRWFLDCASPASCITFCIAKLLMYGQ